VERHLRGETQGLTWAVREFVYLSIEARRAHGERYYETPRSIARRFSAGARRVTAQQVHDALRDDRVVVRAGRDGDERREWVVCTDGARRRAIKAGYRRTPKPTPKPVPRPAPKEDAGENPRQADSGTPGRIPGRPGEIPGVSTPIDAGENPRATEHTSTHPLEETFRTRPKAGVGDGHQEGDGTGHDRAAREARLLADAALGEARSSMPDCLRRRGVFIAFAAARRLMAPADAEAAVAAAMAGLDAGAAREALASSFACLPCPPAELPPVERWLADALWARVTALTGDKAAAQACRRQGSPRADLARLAIAAISSA